MSSKEGICCEIPTRENLIKGAGWKKNSIFYRYYSSIYTSAISRWTISIAIFCQNYRTNAKLQK